MAIVLDIDETLLDNSPHQALMIVSDSNYPYMWNEWCALAKAEVVPGALEFLKYADKKGFQIYYISNRKEKYTREGTLKNLLDKGFPQVRDSHVLLRLERTADNPKPSDKQPRRDIVTANGHDIVLLIGDNLGDFYSDEHDGGLRQAQVDSFKSEFGNKFIILPNAMYGNWPASIGISDAASMDSLLHDMVGAFED
jgi:5'-nucleotidase (lipoprotein e(P4) family)